MHPDSDALVCTLCEGRYWHGTAVLINSLVRRGFRGPVHVGHRGPVPDWFARQQPGGGGILIVTHALDTPRHLTNYKPDFMLWLAARHLDPRAPGLFYFDPDIVNKCDWAFYLRWIAHGVALCEDVNSPMDGRHPLRREWREYFGLPAESGPGPQPYFNGGFAGVATRDLDFLATWKAYQDLAESRGVDLCGWNHGSRDYLFNKTDQDFLNVAAMRHATRVAPVGREGMDFVAGGQLMSHAIGAMKPWNANYLVSALRGWRPRIVDHQYWGMTQAPMRAHAPVRASFVRAEIKLAAAVGRVFAR